VKNKKITVASVIGKCFISIFIAVQYLFQYILIKTRKISLEETVCN